VARAQKARGLAPRTLHSYRGFARRISEEIGSKELRKLTAADLDRFYAGLIASGLSPKSVQHYHATLRAALRQGRRWGLIAVSPADDASPPVAPMLERHRVVGGDEHPLVVEPRKLAQHRLVDLALVPT
jgi:site-specific recombinase XerC